jgi:hypothetical protein
MKNTIFILLITFTSINTAWARAPKEFSLDRTAIILNTEGISFKPFRDMKPEQIKPLEVKSYTMTRGTEVKKIEAYNFQSLWLKDNKIATYKNPLVNLDFYKLNYLPPTDVPLINGMDVDLNLYKKAIKKIESWDEKNTLAWLKQVTGKNAKLEDKYPKLHYSLKTMLVDYGQNDTTFGILLSSKDNKHYFINLTMRGGDAKDADRAMQGFVRYIKIDKVREVKKSSFQSSKFKPSGKVSPEYQKVLDEIKQQVLNTKGWWFTQTNNYILKSNMGTKKKTFAKKVQTHLEFIRTVFERFIPPIVEINAVSVLTIPSTKEEYAAYIPQGYGWSAGIWMPGRKELAVSAFTSNESALLSVLRHEAFHQYIFYATGEKRIPVWYNEGHADMFQAIKQSGSRVTIVEDSNHLRSLLPLFKRKAVSIKKHISLDHAQFYAESSRSLNYSTAWSLVYYLRKAAPLYKDKRYSTILPNALKAIAKGDSPDEINKKAFYGIDLDAFETDFFKFWEDKRMRSKALKNIIVPRK